MTNPPSLTDEQVAAIRARLEATGRRQWWIAMVGDGLEVRARNLSAPLCVDRVALCSDVGAEADADFIAHAPEDIDALLTDRDRLARRVEELEADRARLGKVRWPDAPPSLDDAFVAVARMAEACKSGVSDDLRDIRTADVIAMVGDLRARAAFLYSLQNA